ncbi:hypothetical protein PoB_003207700 [Plakobranchus ocellatus]|uniref:Uncharacterized protein n=1 Tax=Plakobranchus ocellatus TaxID=259542 RepID=A0AAV4AEB1_9GAST|nr:hypothetical protein PoB_003207700 [Plakobranchus ocellatus]
MSTDELVANGYSSTSCSQMKGSICTDELVVANSYNSSTQRQLRLRQTSENMQLCLHVGYAQVELGAG